MGQSSQAGGIIVRTQTVQGTYNADTGAAGVGIPLRSGALAPNRELLIPDPEIGGNRDVADAYLGAVSWSGDYEYYVGPDSIATFLKAAMGTCVDQTTTGVNTHTITGADTAALPFLSIEESIGASLECFQYTDAVVNTLHFESDANGYLMGTAGLIAAKQTAGNVRTPAPVWDTSPSIVGTNVTITYNAISLPARSFSLDINNNFEDDDYRLGSFFIGDLSPKRREITASFSIREKDSVLWRQAVYGVSSATSPGGLATKQQLVITCKTYETISGSTPVTQYGIVFTIPNFVLQPYPFGVSGDDIITDDISGQAVRPDPLVSLMTTVVTNNKATVS
jgi:hypothetical protein